MTSLERIKQIEGFYINGKICLQETANQLLCSSLQLDPDEVKSNISEEIFSRLIITVLREVKIIKEQNINIKEEHQIIMKLKESRDQFHTDYDDYCKAVERVCNFNTFMYYRYMKRNNLI